MRKIRLEEPLSLRKITDSGQCFRPVELESGLYRFITGAHILYCEQHTETELRVSCGAREWEQVWRNYFDLDRNYRAVCAPFLGEKRRAETVSGTADTSGTEFVEASIRCGWGIRVLRQNPWEMLASFILSQRKSIPAIRTAIRLLCERFGRKKETAYEAAPVSLFPAPELLCNLSPEELLDCGLGYRAAYLRDAAEKTCDGTLEPARLASLEDAALYEALCGVHGVGKKIANCVMLFGYGRSERVPSDVWISRIVEKKFAGTDPFPDWENAGLLQQYVFYYALEHKAEFRQELSH